MKDSIINIGIIRTLLEQQSVVWRNHVLVRMRQRLIKIKDIISCINYGEIIEYYHDDYPYPSCLILGFTTSKLKLHVVCAVGNNKLWIITAYYPDKNEWYEDLKTRRR